MTKPKRNRKLKKQGGAGYAALAVCAVILLAVGAFFISGKWPPPPSSKPAPAPGLKQPAPTQKPPEAQKPESAPPPHQQTMSAARVSPPPPPAPSIPKQPAAVPESAGAGQLAIIIDDMGAGMHEARSLAGIGVPLTFSIIPGLKSSSEVAAFAASSGIEVMIHIPMQSKGWPERRLEANGLLVSMSDAEISARIDDYIRTIPGAAGANNHMGSEFTEREDKMGAVLSGLKDRGMFFIDSVTSSNTAGNRLARKMGMKSAQRNVFLDNEQNDAYIRGQISQAVHRAKKSGRAIAICHPHPVTIQTLATVLPGLKKQGVTLVTASHLVR